jgi:RecB family exonuclease
VDIIDYKTGQVHADHAQQRSLYALGGLQLVKIGALAGGDKKVQLTAQHVYVETGQTATEKFAMASLAPLKREWAARTAQMMKDTTFRPKPSRFACKWCKFAKSRGGPCKDEAR